MLTPRQMQADRIIIDQAIAMLRAGGIDLEVIDYLQKGSDRLWLTYRRSEYRGLECQRSVPE